MSQETQQSLADTTASSPPLRSGTPPLSSYRMLESSDSEADIEREVAQLTAVDNYPQTNRMGEYIASMTNRLQHHGVGLESDKGSGRPSSNVAPRPAQRSPSPQPSASISQQGFSPTPSMQDVDAQTNRGELSPRVLEAFGGQTSPPHSGTLVTLVKTSLGTRQERAGVRI